MCGEKIPEKEYSQLKKNNIDWLYVPYRGLRSRIVTYDEQTYIEHDLKYWRKDANDKIAKTIIDRQK